MSKQLYPLLGKFNFGEVSPLLNARVDLQKYAAGCKKLENFIPLLQGPVQRRGGTRYINESGNSDSPVVLVNFAYSETTSYLLVFGNSYMDVYYNNVKIFRLATHWAQNDLFDSRGITRLKWVQSGDIMYIVCPGRAPTKLMRYGHTDWRLQWLPGWNTGVKSRPNATAIALFRERLCLASGQTIYMSQSGSFENFEIAEARFDTITVYVQSAGFVANITGNVINFDNRAGLVWNLAFVAGEVSFAQSGTTITCKTQAGFDSFSKVQFSVTANSGGSGTDGRVGWETNATMGRIVIWEGPKFHMYWNSRFADVAIDYTVASEEGRGSVVLRPATEVVSSDDPIEINVYSEQMDKIEWLVPGSSLVVGTSGGEFHVGEQSTSQPLGPENIKISPETVFGSNPIQALRVGAIILFVQRSGQKLREFSYNLYGDNYQASEITIAAEHITGDGIIDMIWQSEPIETLWCVRSDGRLIGFTYSADQDMNAWHQHYLGGGGLVSQIAVLPAGPGGRDRVYLSVKRVVNGESKYIIEEMTSGHYDPDKWDYGSTQPYAFFVDGGLIVEGSQMTEVSGLWWMEGQEVAILGDGGVQPSQVVVNGMVPLKYKADVVVVGFPYVSTLTTSNLDFSLNDGTAQGRTKRATKVTLDILNSLGGEVGRDEEIEGLNFRMGYSPLSKAPALRSGYFPVLWPYGHEVEGEITIRQKYPLPFVLRAILPEVTI